MFKSFQPDMTGLLLVSNKDVSELETLFLHSYKRNGVVFLEEIKDYRKRCAENFPSLFSSMA